MDYNGFYTLLVIIGKRVSALLSIVPLMGLVGERDTDTSARECIILQFLDKHRH